MNLQNNPAAPATATAAQCPPAKATPPTTSTITTESLINKFLIEYAAAHKKFIEAQLEFSKYQVEFLQAQQALNTTIIKLQGQIAGQKL